LRQQVLGSCKCDCRQQLDFALEAIDAEPLGGVVIYMQQARPA
jgi:GTP cyclohydrolase II